MTREPKRKISVTLDADLVAEVEANGGENLSARVNSALRADLEQQRRRRALSTLLDALAEERGPLGTAEDEAEIARFMRLLGGTPDDSADQLQAS